MLCSYYTKSYKVGFIQGQNFFFHLFILSTHKMEFSTWEKILSWLDVLELRTNILHRRQKKSPVNHCSSCDKKIKCSVTHQKLCLSQEYFSWLKNIFVLELPPTAVRSQSCNCAKWDSRQHCRQYFVSFSFVRTVCFCACVSECRFFIFGVLFWFLRGSHAPIIDDNTTVVTVADWCAR